MKNIFLIIEGQLGENLQELLGLEGYETRIWGEIEIDRQDSFADLYIGTAEMLQKEPSWVKFSFLDQNPFILLSAEGNPQEDLPKACQNLPIPFYGDHLIEAIQICKDCRIGNQTSFSSRVS